MDTEKEMTDDEIQWIGWSFQEYQCPILNVKRIARKKKSNVALFRWGIKEVVMFTEPAGSYKEVEAEAQVQMPRRGEVTQLSWDQFREQQAMT